MAITVYWACLNKEWHKTEKPKNAIKVAKK